jgi:very-short-patch-repair endonuclease
MSDDRLDACEVVRRLGGNANWAQILRHSTSHSVRRALRSGELRRIGRGSYALPETPAAYQVAAATRGLVSHSSAASHWKLDTLTAQSSTHVTVPAHSRSRVWRDVSFHFSNVPPGDDHNGVTSPLRTVLDCALTLSFAEGLTIADSALRRALVTSEQLIVAAHKRRGPGRQRIIRVAEAADGSAANPFESGLRAIVLEAGISDFRPQLPVPLPSGTIYVDLGDPQRQMALEADSHTYHLSPDALVRDCERYNELIRCGWLPLRFAWQHVMFDQSWLASIVTDTCAIRDRRNQRRCNSAKGAQMHPRN